MSPLLGSLLGEAALLANQPAPVVLGPLTLTGPEAPTRIVIGGAHLAAIHKLPGGGRVIDAMGPDDGAVVWQGVFIGPTAASRVRTVDAIRISGQPCTLAFGDYMFEIMIVEFQYSYESRGAVISYHLRAEKTAPATQDVSQTALEGAFSDCVLATQFVTNTQASIATYGGSVNGVSNTPVSALAGILATLVQSKTTLSQTGSLGVVRLPASALAASAAGIQNILPLLSVGNLAGQAVPFSVQSGDELVSVVQDAGALAASVGAGGYINRATASLAYASAETNAVGIHS